MAQSRRSNKKEPTVADKVRTAFLVTFDNDNGRLALAYLKSLYHDRTSVSIDFDANRALASEACRSVYLTIISIIKEAKRHAAGDDYDIAEFDIDSGIDAAGSIFEQ